MKKFIQEWLGIDSFSSQIRDWVDARVAESESAINEINSKVRALMGAGSDIESAISQLDDANAKLHAEHLERVDVLRNAIQDTRNECGNLRTLVAQQNAEISQLTQSINKLENPGYNPIG